MSLTASAGKIWVRIQGELRGQLPAALYSTWVAGAEPIDYSEGVLTIAVGNRYAREKLLELDSLSVVANEILGRSVEIRVVIPGDEQPLEGTGPQLGPGDSEAVAAAKPDDDEGYELETEYLREYDRIVRPERIIAFPRYYLRWIPYLGIDLAWLPISFRQVAYLRGLDYKPGEVFQASGREIANWAGMTLRTFRRRVNDPLLSWFILPTEPEDAKGRWSIGEDSIPHREPSSWRVVMSMPMTPVDQDALTLWLQLKAADMRSKEEALRAARETPVDLLIPWPPQAGLVLPEVADPPISVEDVIRKALNLGEGPLSGATDLLVNALVHHITGESLLVTHYFVREWLPIIGSGPGWLVTLMRSVGYPEVDPKSEVVFEGGYPQIAELLGLGNHWRIGRWLRETGTGASNINSFVEEMDSWKGSDQRFARKFHIRRHEPLTPAHLERASKREEDNLSKEGPRDSGTHGQGGSRSFGTHDAGGPRDAVSYAEQGPRDLVTYEPVGPRESVTASPQVSTTYPQSDRESGTVKIGGGIHSDNVKRDTTTSIVDNARTADSSGWTMEYLLRNAGVSPTARESIKKANPVALISWLLYAASERGAGIQDPIGHAISRLRDDPWKGAGGYFDQLARLGKMELAELIAREIGFGGARFSNSDWGRVMDGANRERLSLVVSIIGGSVDIESE